MEFKKYVTERDKDTYLKKEYGDYPWMLQGTSQSFCGQNLNT